MRNTLRLIWRILTAPFRLIVWIGRGIVRWTREKAAEVNYFFTEEVDDAPIGEALNKAWEHPNELMVHVDALRKHLLRAVLVLGIMTALSFVFFQQILSFLAAPLEGGMESLVAIEVTEPVGTVMRVALLTGFALAFPYIAFEAFLFIAPGLDRKLRIYGLLAIPIATLFFFGGMIFAYYVLLPSAIPFLINFMGIQTIPRPSSYVRFVTAIMFWIGIAFEFPLIVFLLAKVGLVRARAMLNQWRLAVVIIAVAAAVITPTVDPINMALVMGPLIVLYFFSIFLAWLAQPRSA
ncbi:MAG: twin-arginine translocase subunit TatC [Anaerolineae bacterium]|jgi:sec-independent protein translocase protein TatC|nr:twin-arginine translocase subunit TatC [Anaerolineae bacterium]MCZ7553309.1 twin-arginine translocase subunit TatC [Anaerolineales bacterium]